MQELSIFSNNACRGTVASKQPETSHSSCNQHHKTAVERFVVRNLHLVTKYPANRADILHAYYFKVLHPASFQRDYLNKLFYCALAKIAIDKISVYKVKNPQKIVEISVFFFRSYRELISLYWNHSVFIVACVERNSSKWLAGGSFKVVIASTIEVLIQCVTIWMDVKPVKMFDWKKTLNTPCTVPNYLRVKL